MFAPHTYDPRVMPTAGEYRAAHALWADYLVDTKATTPDRAAVIRSTPVAEGGVTPYWGLIAAARLTARGVRPSKNPPSLLAIWVATALYNAEFDIDRNMRANEKPFDLIIEPSEPFLRALVQEAIEQIVAATKPTEGKDVLTARMNGYRQALDEVAAAVEGLRR